ncbi:MAG: MBL fold metallo-hydrolase [Actinobacteria bacterium]|nr:MBL fold metallo-hydrolase [Actinomycetota bacterium]
MASTLEDEFGDIIAKARRGLGIERDALARSAGLAPEAVAAFEAYTRRPTRDECARVAARLQLDPAALWDIAAEAWQPAQVTLDLEGGARVAPIPHPPMRVTMYVVGDAASRQALVIDPGADAPAIQRVLEQHAWEMAGILVTHADHDHVGALAAVEKERRVPVWVHADEHVRLRGVPLADVRAFEGDRALTVGPFQIQAVETFGHAAGHTAYALRNAVFVGDSMFAGSLGRPLNAALYAGHLASVRDKILGLPPATKLFAGHGPPTTVGEERAHNPFFAGQFRN